MQNRINFFTDYCGLLSSDVLMLPGKVYNMLLDDMKSTKVYNFNRDVPIRVSHAKGTYIEVIRVKSANIRIPYVLFMSL